MSTSEMQAQHRRQTVAQLEKLHILRQLRLRQMLPAARLSCSQVHLLEYLRQHSGCCQTDVAAVIGVTPAAVAMSVKRLGQLGYLTATVSPENQRYKRLELTAVGRQALADCRGRMESMEEAMFAPLSEAELLTLEQLLGKIAYHMETEMGRTPTGTAPEDLRNLVQAVAHDCAVSLAEMEDLHD